MTDYSKMKVVELKAELKARGLPQNGLKAELVSRLEAAASEDPQTVPSPDVSGETEPIAQVDEVLPSGAAESPHEKEEAQIQEPLREPSPEPAREPSPVPAQETAQEPAQEHHDKMSEAAIQHSPSRDEAPLPIAATTIVSETPSLATTELVQDQQKRKRRSTTPPPSDEIARKRPRQDGQEESREVPTLPHAMAESHNNVTQEASMTDVDMAAPTQDESRSEQEPSDRAETTDMARPAENAPSSGGGLGSAEDSLMADADTSNYEREKYSTTSENLNHATHERTNDFSSPERDIEPAIHPATKALYIKNFMRPLKPQAVQEHLLELATPASNPIDPSTISNFYLDNIRTHAFAVFASVSAASRVRNALHKRVWPDETNRKALWVDFMPPDCFDEWVDTEMRAKERGNMPRYEVVYDRDDDGYVVAKLDEVDANPPVKRAAPPSPIAPLDRKTSIPTGPSRPSGIENAPTGPRNPYAQYGPRPTYPNRHDKQDMYEAGFVSTKTGPSVLFRPVAPELAQQRLDILARAKDSLYDEESGKDYHRYYFERDTFLVDRGPEIFLGIRPPHREKERRELARNGGLDTRDRGFRDRRPPTGPAAGGGGRRRRRPPRPHGVPRGGDRFRPPGSTYEDRFGNDDRRPSRLGGGGGRRGDSYRH
ncbi:hypothetical protein F5Y17DRAFT_442089 [Xylariaceae sp. FL0594]|nr:hypothetical protein F5Y17DRAFT_442089 [Xylariaceae sp. FL0594]